MNSGNRSGASHGSFSACFNVFYSEVTLKNEKWKKKPETQHKVIKLPYVYALYLTFSYYVYAK